MPLVRVGAFPHPAVPPPVDGGELEVVAGGWPPALVVVGRAVVVGFGVPPPQLLPGIHWEL